MLRERFGVSERRACRVVGQHRSTERLSPPVVCEEERRLREFLIAFSKARPRWGWRRAAKGARRAGWVVNDKRVRRLWRQEGLRVPRRRRKKRLSGVGTQVGSFCPIRPDVVWALDFQFDTTTDGRTLKLLHVVDEHTREAHEILVRRTIDADEVVAVLDRLTPRHGAPGFIRMDNGPEMTANAIRDWCSSSGSKTFYIEPGSPWENPFVESFGSRVRDEVLAVEMFTSLLEAKIVIEDWRIMYNTTRPHSSLGWTPPSVYADACRRGL